jgi:hypothetical protein
MSETDSIIVRSSKLFITRCWDNGLNSHTLIHQRLKNFRETTASKLTKKTKIEEKT